MPFLKKSISFEWRKGEGTCVPVWEIQESLFEFGAIDGIDSRYSYAHFQLSRTPLPFHFMGCLPHVPCTTKDLLADWSSFVDLRDRPFLWSVLQDPSSWECLLWAAWRFILYCHLWEPFRFWEAKLGIRLRYASLAFKVPISCIQCISMQQSRSLSAMHFKSW